MSAETYAQTIQDCLQKATDQQSKVPPQLLTASAMSGKMTRHFYNNLLSSDGVRYLEVGTWNGVTLCAALYGNSATVTCVDNWSQFSGPRALFNSNLAKYKGDNHVTVVDGDCFAIDPTTLGKFNIYMYDADHSEQSQYDALVHMQPALDDTFVYIVDDWNYDRVREGTNRAVIDLGLVVNYQHEIKLTEDGSVTPKPALNNTWWNGIYVAVLTKPRLS